MDFKEQTVIVTGGGYGIGKEIALTFGRQGANVVLAARSGERIEAVAQQLRAMGTRPLAVPFDVASEEACKDMVEQAHQTFGRIDALVNNSGIAGPTALARDTRAEDWRETLEVNLSGAFYCAKYVSAVMIEHKRGTIINIASVAGRMGFPMRTPYAASKWGMIGLSHSLAAELGPYNIRVNVICPGPIQGTRLQQVIEARSKATGRPYDELMAETVRDIPLRRLPEEADVAQSVLFLASESAGSISGQIFNVDGGFRIQ